MSTNEKKPKFVMEFAVKSSAGTERIKTMSRAWARSLELPRPVTTTFLGMVREDVD